MNGGSGGRNEGHIKTLCNDGASSESGYEALLRMLFHRGFRGIALFDDSISSIASALD